MTEEPATKEASGHSNGDAGAVGSKSESIEVPKSVQAPSEGEKQAKEQDERHAQD